MENSYLAANAKNSSEEEVMYFLIGAIVSTIVLVIYSQSFPLLHYFAISGACSPHPFHPAQENQLGDPSVPRGRPRGARHAPPRPRAPPHLPRPRHHHRHLDVRQSLDIHRGRSDRGQGDQVHQVYARLLPLVDAMVRAMVVVVLIFISLSRAKKRDCFVQVPCLWLPLDHSVLYRLSAPRHCGQCCWMVFLKVSRSRGRHF